MARESEADIREFNRALGKDGREALTMALYVSLSLQAVLLTTPSREVTASPAAEALTVFLTAVGLLLAHQVAFRMSTRMTNRGVLDAETVASLRAQTIGGLPVAFVAAMPLLLIGSNGLVVSEVLLLGFVAVVGYLSVRAGGAGRTRALMYVLGLALVIAAVLALKIIVKH